MLSFKRFLTENKRALKDHVHDLSDLISIVYKAPDRWVKELTDLLDELEAEIVVGEIYNVTHSKVKEAASSLLGRTFERIGDQYHMLFDSPAWKAFEAAKIDPWLPSHIDGGNVKKVIKEYTAALAVPNIPTELTERLKKQLRIAKVYLEITETLKSVKEKLIKARKPKPVDPDAPAVFQSRMGSSTSQAVIRGHLQASIKSALDNFEQKMAGYYKGQIDAMLELPSEFPASKLTQTQQSIMFRAFEYEMKGWNETRRVTGFKAKPEAKTYHITRAARDRKEIEESFLHKNTLKLSLLLDKKSNLQKVDVLPAEPVTLHHGAGTLTTGMKFSFSDGSGFHVRNKVIINHTAKGESFYQYPTTFHDVILPNGTKLASPSEEKMIKVFGA